jgi:succinate-semialdehyde dehydrogenase / glutarate-semialdehyde dehydrogenase
MAPMAPPSRVSGPRPIEDRIEEHAMTQTPPYQVTDPATGEVTQTFPFATDAEVEQALAASTAAFTDWKKRPVHERAAIVKRVGELFGERAADLAALITKEMGKRPAQAVGEAEFCNDIFGYYADNGPALLADKPLPGHDGARVEYLPIGPVLGIMPWNYPYYQVARFAAPNLVAGNTVILKHAENCPTSALAIAEIMREAGVPDGVYVNIFATHEQAAAMIADPRLRGVSLTGSERAGTAVAETAGRNLKKVVLELGGSDPYIILDTDDVEEAAKTAWVTRMENVGQACNSNKRMIVMDDIYDDFVAALVNRASKTTPRQPGDDSPKSYSPMVSRKAAENLLAQVQDAVSKGATLHVGGTLGEAGGAYFAPAVLTGVTPDMRAYREELFGPVAVVYKVSNDDEAVKLANVVDYGLGGAVWSTDEARATAVAEQLEVGMANVNTPAGEGADLPFGGTKRSGFGRELGPLGIDEFVNKRLFYVQK